MESLYAIGSRLHLWGAIVGLPNRIDIVPASVFDGRSCVAEHETACFKDDLHFRRV